MGTKPIGRSSVWHGRDNRLPDGGISQVNKLLVVQRLKDDAVPQQKVCDDGHREQLPNSHAAHHQRLGPVQFRQL